MSLLDVAYHVVHDAPGGAKALAARMGRNATTLSHELIGTGSAKLGLLDAKKITDMTGDQRILQAWATETGNMLVPLPDMDRDAPSGTDCLMELARVSKEFSDVTQQVSKSLANDGLVTDNELNAIDLEIGEQIAALHLMRVALAMNNAALRSKAPKGWA